MFHICWETAGGLKLCNANAHKQTSGIQWSHRVKPDKLINRQIYTVYIHELAHICSLSSQTAMYLYSTVLSHIVKKWLYFVLLKWTTQTRKDGL